MPHPRSTPLESVYFGGIAVAAAGDTLIRNPRFFVIREGSRGAIYPFWQPPIAVWQGCWRSWQPVLSVLAMAFARLARVLSLLAIWKPE